MNKLDKQIIRSAKRLAQKECSNYADGSCLPEGCTCYAVNPAYVTIHEKTLPTLIQTNETYESTQIDAFFESKPKIDAFLKIDANAQRQEYKMAS